MNEQYYDAIFKRKSFHLFRDVGQDKLSPEELEGIEKVFAEAERLCPDIKTAIRIVPSEERSFKRDAEYCVLIYSEKKENYLMNAGYIGQQLDLWCVSHNIGSLWYGLGKTDEQSYMGLDYVIMLAVRKVKDDTKFRKDMFRAKRKPLEDTWSGEPLRAAEIARFAPSAVNSQPWYVENKDNVLTVYRYRKPGRIGIMPASAAQYFNRIDIGIYLCILELCLLKDGFTFERELFPDDGGDRELTRSAVYRLTK